MKILIKEINLYLNTLLILIYIFQLILILQEKAIFRLKFEEIFFNQLIFQLKKNKIKSK